MSLVTIPFDQLPTLEVSNVETTQDLSLETKDKDAPNDNLWKFPIDNDILYKLQQEDVFYRNILSQIEKGNIVEGQLYLIKDNVLKRYIIDGDNTYETTVVPKALTAQILRMAHDELGHNGTHRTYTLLKRLLLERVKTKCRETLKCIINVREEINR